MRAGSAVAAAGERNKVVGLICGGHFYSHFSWLILPPLFPLMRAEFGASYLALGALMIAFAVATGVSQIPCGLLVDRFGARPVLLAGLTLLALPFALVGLTGELWHLMVLTTVAGLANGVFHPADYAILSARVDERFLGRAMSVHSFSGYIGWAAAPAAMLGLSELMDWRSAVSVAGFAGLAVAALLCWQGASLDDAAVRRPRPRDRRSESESALRRGLETMRSTSMISLLVFFVFLATVSGAVNSFSVVGVMALFDADRALGNYALTGFLVAHGAGVLIGGVLADSTARHSLVAGLSAAGAAAAFFFVALAFAPVLAAVTAMALAGLLLGVANPSRDLLVRAAAPPGALGVAYGFTSTGLGIGSAIGPAIGGWAMDAGQPSWLFLALCAASLLCVAAAGLTRPHRRADPA